MALKDTIKKMHASFEHLSKDLKKAEGGNKAAAQRVRTGSIELAKLSKQYRKESVAATKGGSKKKARKTATKRAAPTRKKGIKKKAKTTRLKKRR